MVSLLGIWCFFFAVGANLLQSRAEVSAAQATYLRVFFGSAASLSGMLLLGGTGAAIAAYHQYIIALVGVVLAVIFLGIALKNRIFLERKGFFSLIADGVNSVWVPSCMFFAASAVWIAQSLYNLPGFGWDFLSYWGPSGVERWSQISLDRGLAASSFSAHPAVLSGLIALAIELESEADAASILFLMYVLGGVSIAMALVCLGLSWGVRGLPLIIPPSLVVMAPLCLNHFLVVGYSELWVAGICMLLFGMPTVYKVSHHKAWLLLAFILSVQLVFLRNTGVLNLFAVLAVLMVVYFGRLSFVILVAIGAVAIGASYMLGGLQVEIGNVRIGWLLDPLRVQLAGYSLPIHLPRLASTMDILASSMLLNQSFSIFLVTFLICIFASVLSFRGFTCREAQYMILGPLVQLFLVCSGLLTEYGLEHSKPMSDTIFSRQIIIFFVSSMPLVMFTLSRISHPRLR